MIKVNKQNTKHFHKTLSKIVILYELFIFDLVSYLGHFAALALWDHNIYKKKASDTFMQKQNVNPSLNTEKNDRCCIVITIDKIH